MSKEEIIRRGRVLGLDYSLTWSCYKGGETPCGVCDSCRIREAGMEQAK
jgi:7-cyano-7-deazaguanine synthase